MKQTIEIEVPDGKKAVWKDGKVVFEDIKPQLPKTWVKFCEQNDTKEGECFLDNSCYTIKVGTNKRHSIFNRNILPSKQAAEQHLALMQLHQLRDCYRQGWKPDYSDNTIWYIEKYGCEFRIDFAITRVSFLSFQTQELAGQFLANFKDLIEQAGDLI